MVYDYKVLHGASVYELVTEVERCLADGYILLGGAQPVVNPETGNIEFYQTALLGTTSVPVDSYDINYPGIDEALMEEHKAQHQRQEQHQTERTNA